MADSIKWLVRAGVLVVLELSTGTFYLLMVTFGLGFGALVALGGMNGAVQTVVTAVVGVLATGLLLHSRLGRPVRRGNTARDPNVNIDIGQHIPVDQWYDGRARVMYRGALWDVELGQSAHPQVGVFEIVGVQGSRLIVTGA